jgi:hypothetical protein
MPILSSERVPHIKKPAIVRRKPIIWPTDFYSDDSMKRGYETWSFSSTKAQSNIANNQFTIFGALAIEPHTDTF